MTTRLALRAEIGAQAPRNYYKTSVTTAVAATASRIMDAARTEHDKFWSGAYIRVAGQDRLVRGGTGASVGRTPQLYVDVPFAAPIGNAVTYELAKGWPLTDYDKAIDRCLEASYPWLFDPIDDRATVVEDPTLQPQIYALPPAWREVDGVREQIFNSNPLDYRALFETQDYFLRQGAAGLELELRFQPTTPQPIWFTGQSIATLGAADNANTIAPIAPIVHGALYFLYSKGVQPDEGQTEVNFQSEAQRHFGIWQGLLHSLPMADRGQRTIIAPRVRVVNDGRSTTTGGW